MAAGATYEPIETQTLGSAAPSVTFSSIVGTYTDLRIVVAAGNGGADACLFSPSSATGAITVGSVNIKDQIAPFSNHGSCVDLYTPGVKIIGAAGGEDTYIASGTSASSPLVAGIMAIQMEHKGCNAQLLTYKQKRNLKFGFTGRKV